MSWRIHHQWWIMNQKVRCWSWYYIYIYYIMLNQKVRCVYIIYIYSYHHMFLKIVEADMNRHMPRHPDWNAAIGRLQETCDKPMGLSAPETWRMEWSDRKSGGNWGKHGFVPWNFDKIHDFFGGFALNCSVQFSKTWPWLRNERRMLRIQLRRYALKCRKKPHGIQSMTIPFPVEWHWLSNICIYIDIYIYNTYIYVYI